MSCPVNEGYLSELAGYVDMQDNQSTRAINALPCRGVCQQHLVVSSRFKHSLGSEKTINSVPGKGVFPGASSDNMLGTLAIEDLNIGQHEQLGSSCQISQDIRAQPRSVSAGVQQVTAPAFCNL